MNECKECTGCCGWPQGQALLHHQALRMGRNHWHLCSGIFASRVYSSNISELLLLLLLLLLYVTLSHCSSLHMLSACS
jgi:hypothetical protein